MPEHVKRQELWRARYDARRYLEHASATELAQRAFDVMANLATLTYKGQMGLLGRDDGGEYWLEMLTHILEEYAFRRSGLPPFVADAASFPKPTYPVKPRAGQLLSALGDRLNEEPYLVKFGESDYLESTFHTGNWRISPASSYADPSLNPARRDAELELTVYGLPSEVLIEVRDGRTGQFKTQTRPLGNLAVTSRCMTNYYVSCLSKRLDLRLFDDFGADCCIVIRNPLEFAKRIFQASRAALPGWKGFLHDVAYVDPFNPPTGRVDVFVSKHFRYWYQKEVRFLWVPDKPQSQLPHMFLELGDISDVCQFVRL